MDAYRGIRELDENHMDETLARVFEYIRDKGYVSAHEYGARLGGGRTPLERVFSEVRCFDVEHREGQIDVEIADVCDPQYDADVIFALHTFEIILNDYNECVQRLRKHCKLLVMSHHELAKLSKMGEPDGLVEVIEAKQYKHCSHVKHIIHIVEGFL